MLTNKVAELTVLALLLTARGASAQTFMPIGDPEVDKRVWLADQPLPVAVKPLDTNTVLNGVLWPTIVQVNAFRQGDPNLAGVDSCAHTPDNAVTITAGNESGADHVSSPRSHITGFKVDLRVNNRCSADPVVDPLSVDIIEVAPAQGVRNDPNGGVARTQTSSNSGFNGVIFALEYPLTAFPTATTKPFIPNFIHWDVLSSYTDVSVTPSTLTVNVGDVMSVSPVASANGATIPNIQPWMFDYYFPSDPNETIATIDRTGSITGTAGTVIGVGCGVPPCSTVLLVSEGPYLNFVDITVNAPDPPGGGPVCSFGVSTGCWSWQGNSWNWNPPSPVSSTPNPPALPPPPFGVCGSPVGLPPCWQWNPTANNGGGSWTFVPPSGSFPGTITSPIISPAQSVDPNAISGPTGAGAAQYISLVSPTGYTIYFENEPTATAAADLVVASNQIDPTRFDLTTVSLGPITFPGSPGVLPPSVPIQTLGQFSTQIGLTTKNLLVNVTASLNSTTGLLTWTLQAIDPNTGLPPVDPSLGVLPPGGGGSVSFTAKLLPSLTTGTVVNDQATVTFDANAPISTAVWSNTLDAAAPTSRVSVLPSSEPAASFVVNWSGTDAGSGIQSFTIYVSDSGGPYGKWLAQTLGTSAQFIGNIGHTYSFYSVATDFAGNTEAAKTSPDSTTTVTVPCAADASASFAIARGGFRLNHATQQFTQTVTIQNKSTAAITGPISLVLDSLSSNASLTGGNGVTACNTPLNSEFSNLNLGTNVSLAPGATNTVTLTFTNPSQGGITYSTRVLTGAGAR